MTIACTQVHAGNVLDYIRNADLNDFALGLAYSQGQTPYLGGDKSSFAYPYLTSFRNPAFTDDWLVFSNGDLGARWTSEGGWVLGAVGRIQTLGTGDLAIEELIGFTPRHWTIEMAPLVGWRGWPIHLDYKLYKEISGRHGGLTSELRVSYPTEWDWGYLIPELAAIRQDENYTGYYFGVEPPEITPPQNAYSPGPALNYQARLTWGYAISDKWLLSGHITSEWLDPVISNSPIVDKDQLWSANIGLAYNADVFQAREYDGFESRLPRFEFRVGAFDNNVDTRIVRAPVDGGPGEEIDLEEVLGATDKKTVMQLDAIFRFGRYHRLEIGYFQLGRDTVSVLQTDINVGDELIPAGTEIDLRSELRVTKVAYGYSLINDAQKELGVMAGVHITRLEAEIFAPQTQQREKVAVSTPLPVIGVFGGIAVGRKTNLGARIQIFRMEFDHFAGSMNFIFLGLQHNFNQHLGAGVGYNFYSLNLDSSDDELNGSLRIRHNGPVVFVSALF